MMPNNHLIYLIGFMGSGKTTAGKKLANMLGWSFIDLDKAIEEKLGMTIPDIFSRYGEAYFRIAESEVLKDVVSHEDTVISTGGGTPCHGDNMNYMLTRGITIYLRLTPGQLKARLSKSKGERPLIKGLSDEELLDFITNKLAERDKWYSLAEITYDGIDVDINLIYSSVKDRLNR